MLGVLSSLPGAGGPQPGSGPAGAASAEPQFPTANSPACLEKASGQAGSTSAQHSHTQGGLENGHQAPGLTDGAWRATAGVEDRVRRDLRGLQGRPSARSESCG